MTTDRPVATELDAIRWGSTEQLDGVEVVIYRVPGGRVVEEPMIDTETGEFISKGHYEPVDGFDVFQARFADDVQYRRGFIREPYSGKHGIWYGWGIQSPTHNHAGWLASGPTVEKALAAAKRRLRKIKADTNALLALRGFGGMVISDAGYRECVEAAVVFEGDLVVLGALGKWRVGVVEKITKTGNATIAYTTPSNTHRVHRVTRPTLGLRKPQR